MSDSLRPHGLYGPWSSPGQNTGVGSLSLLQGIFPTQGWNPGLPQCVWILYQQSHKGSPRILLPAEPQGFLENSSDNKEHLLSTYCVLGIYFMLYKHTIIKTLWCMFNYTFIGVPWWLSGKETACNAGDPGSISGSGRSPGDNPLQYSCLENFMDRGAWQGRVHRVTK